MKIEGLPDGWEVVAFRKPKAGDWYFDTRGEVAHANVAFISAIMPILRKVWDYAEEQAAWVKEHGIKEGSLVRIGKVDDADYRLRGYGGVGGWNRKRKYAELVVPVSSIQTGSVTCHVEEDGNRNQYDFPFFALTPVKQTWKPWDVNTMPARVQIRPKAEESHNFPRAPYWAHPGDSTYASLGLGTMIQYGRLLTSFEQMDGTPCGIEATE